MTVVEAWRKYTHRVVVEPKEAGKGDLGRMHDPFQKPMHYCDYGAAPIRAFADGVKWRTQTYRKIKKVWRKDDLLMPKQPFSRELRNAARLGVSEFGRYAGTKKPDEGEEGEGGKGAEAAEGEEGAAKDKEKDPNNRQHPKWSGEAVRLLMYAVETNLYRKLANAWKICVHDKRITLSPEDLRLAKDIMQERIDTRFTKTVE
jgi:histone H3/H4